MPSRDRNVGAPGQDVPGVSLHPLPGDSPDREPGEFLAPHPYPRETTPQFSTCPSLFLVTSIILFFPRFYFFIMRDTEREV